MTSMHKFLCVIFAAFVLSLPAHAEKSLFWFECPFAAKVESINLSGSAENPNIEMKLNVLFVTFKRGFLSGRKKKCGFSKRDVITVRNFVTEEERAPYREKGRDLNKEIKISKKQLALLQDGDQVKILYSFFNNDDGDRKVWEFLGGRRR